MLYVSSLIHVHEYNMHNLVSNVYDKIYSMYDASINYKQQRMLCNIDKIYMV